MGKRGKELVGSGRSSATARHYISVVEEDKRKSSEHSFERSERPHRTALFGKYFPIL